MKKGIKILLGLVTAIIVITIVIHFVLQAKLGTIINKAVIPEIKKTLNIDATVGGASLNMLGGSLRLKDVKLGNPESFSEPTIFSLDRCFINIGVLETLKGRTEITEAAIKNAVITVIRNKGSQINAKQIADSLPAPETKRTTPAQKTEKPRTEPKMPEQRSAQQHTKPAEIASLKVKEFSAEAMLEYIDHQLREEITRIAIRTEINVSNLNIAPETETGDGTIALSAHLDGKPDLFVTKINTVIKPIIDPLTPSFTTDGSIVDIDMKQPEMQALLSESDVNADSASIIIHIRSIDGVFQEPESVIEVTLKNCRAAGNALAKNPDFPVIPELTVPIPVKGTVLEPDFGNITTIIANAVLKNLANNTNLIKDLLKKELNKKDDQGASNADRINKEVDRGLKKLGEIFNKL